MTKTDFRNMGEFRAHRDRARSSARAYAQALEDHITDLRDREFRSELVTGAVTDLVTNWKPLRVLSSVWDTEKGALGGLLVGALTARATGFKGKLLTWALTSIGPTLLKGLLQSEWLEQWIASAKDDVDEDRSDPDLDDDHDTDTPLN